MTLLGKNLYSSYREGEETSFKVSNPLKQLQLCEITEALPRLRTGGLECLQQVCPVFSCFSQQNLCQGEALCSPGSW